MLEKYRKMRDFTKTPEPSGAKKTRSVKSKKLTFVFQEHAATRLHFDFRLEYNGILLSWAVPKGPSLNTQDKRLAVKTEDHPLDYAGFEGIIPSGYGAGEVIVWDNGTYEVLDENETSVPSLIEAEKLIKNGLKKGKLLFYLKGKKLEGIWTLVRMHKTEKDWLLIKHKDEFASEKSHPWKDDSILTGETLKDLQTTNTSPSKRKAAKKSPVKQSTISSKNSTKKNLKIKLPGFEPPMLATLSTTSFTNKDWVFEPKLDGIRALAYVSPNGTEIYSRRGQLLAYRYPSLTEELSSNKNSFVIDGELVAFDQNSRPSFERLQERSGLTKVADIKIADQENPIKYYIFDILFLNGKNLRNLPLIERKKILHQTIKPTGHIEPVQELGSDGDWAFKACMENGLEGVVGKKLSSLYQTNRRSADWLKLKSTFTDEFLICGYTQGTGGRKNTFGALILGEYNSTNKLIHVCGVGTGFDDKKIKELLEIMRPLQIKNCPFAKRPIGLDKPTWIEPKLVAEIKFAERTKDNSLRVPVFLHLRDDIEPKGVKPKPFISKLPAMSIKNSDTKSQGKVVVKKTSGKKSPVTKNISHNNETISNFLKEIDNDTDNLQIIVEGNKISFSSLNKPFWPSYNSHPIITKRDYLHYLASVSPWLLPHLKDRLITLIRFPQGIKGPKFFQKHWTENLPKFIETVKVYTEHERKDQDFLMCNNLSSLLWLGQIADLELHTAHSRIDPLPDAKKLPTRLTGSVENLENSLLNYPDFMVFDLDPYLYSGEEKAGDEPELHRKGFRETCKVALWFKELFDQLSLNTFVKTSGKTGLHIYVPIKRNIEYDKVREISHTICKYILAKHPTKVTTDWSVNKRTGKVFLDHNMNARSKSLASIFSPRVSKEAAVSTPLSWDELQDIYPNDFTIETLPLRLMEQGDLWSDILSKKNDLTDLFGRLSAII
jgi:bifunctional non-homologous end joining protein LigD